MVAAIAAVATVDCDAVPRSATQSQRFDERVVAVELFALEIIEQAASLADHLQQTTTGMMIFVVNLEVLGKVSNPLGEKRYLDFR
jgi:hypothetical protein